MLLYGKERRGGVSLLLAIRVRGWMANAVGRFLQGRGIPYPDHGSWAHSRVLVGVPSPRLVVVAGFEAARVGALGKIMLLAIFAPGRITQQYGTDHAFCLSLWPPVVPSR